MVLTTKSIRTALMALLFATAAVAGFLCAFGAASLSAIAAQEGAAVPDFTIGSKSAWLAVGDELLPPPSGRRLN